MGFPGRAIYRPLKKIIFLGFCLALWRVCVQIARSFKWTWICYPPSKDRCISGVFNACIWSQGINTLSSLAASLWLLSTAYQWSRVDDVNLSTNASWSTRLFNSAPPAHGAGTAGHGAQMTPVNLPGGQTWYFDPHIFWKEIFCCTGQLINH